MNYYFLLEDEKSFLKVLPEWFKHMGFQNTRVQDIAYVTENCYVLQSGQGVTQLITHVLFQTIDTILQNPGKIDELIIILDSEEYNEQYRKEQVDRIIKKYISDKHLDVDFTYRIFICNHCFETWLLGNGDLYPKCRPCDIFQNYYDAYNIKEDDPEDMVPPKDIKETIASYHFYYLHEMCRYNKIRYSKKKPMYMATKDYFLKLVDRIEGTNHLHSFSEFYHYFNNRK